MEQVEVLFTFGPLVGADHHFLGATAAGDQSDSGFDESHVGFRRGVDTRPVKRDFAPAA